MLDNVLTWEMVLMSTVLILINYFGIKVINRLFEKNTKKKNSLF